MYLRNFLAILFFFLNCIFTNTNSQYRIQGGSDWDITDSKYLVAIYYDKEYHCVGALITFLKVITSGVCMEDLDATHITVAAGIDNLDKPKLSRKGVRILRPRDCNAEMVDIDLAVIVLDKRFSKSKTIEPISICETDINPDVKLRVSGWGSKAADIMGTSHMLQSAEFELYRRDVCASLYEALEKKLPTTAICLTHHTSDTCWGDSGAPAVAGEKLYAVLSGTMEPLKRYYPTLYTNMNHDDVRAFMGYVRYN